MQSSGWVRRASKWLLASLAIVFVNSAFARTPASNYPDQPIRIYVPFAPGGSTDLMARILAQSLGERLKQNVIIENRPGAGGNIAMGMVARAPADGYTLVVVSSSFVINPTLYKSVPYDVKKSFAPVTYLAASPSLLVVNPKDPAQNVKALVAELKAHPGTYSYSSPGIGTAQHLAGVLFGMRTDTQIVHVPYNGAGPGVTAVVTGVVPMGFASVPSVLGQVQSGQLRALAITTDTRFAGLPQVPTFSQAGFPGVVADHMQGLLAPAGTPPAIIAKLSKATDAVLADPVVVRKMQEIGFIVGGGSPADFSAKIAQEYDIWRDVIEKSGIPKE